MLFISRSTLRVAQEGEGTIMNILIEEIFLKMWQVWLWGWAVFSLILPLLKAYSWLISLIASGLACFIAYRSHRFTQKAWTETYRPLVTVRVEPISEQNWAQNLIVSNTGNRPAKNIVISPVDKDKFESEFFASPEDAKRKYVESCLNTPLPVLANGETMSSNFGSLSAYPQYKTWENDPTVLKVHVSYEDLDGRAYGNDYDLHLSSVRSFGLGVWLSNNEI